MFWSRPVNKSVSLYTASWGMQKYLEGESKKKERERETVCERIIEGTDRIVL